MKRSDGTVRMVADVDIDGSGNDSVDADSSRIMITMPLSQKKLCTYKVPVDPGTPTLINSLNPIYYKLTSHQLAFAAIVLRAMYLAHVQSTVEAVFSCTRASYCHRLLM